VLALAVFLAFLTLVGLPFDVTLWNWLDLLIVPVVLAIGGYLFTRTENRATQAAAERRAQDDALQAYLDQMGQMLLNVDRPLRQSKEGSEARTLARARTLTVLTRVDGERKRSVLQFLYESNLIGKDHALLELSGANLIGARLSKANLRGASLSGADLREADLRGVRLQGADLVDSDLRGANLSESYEEELAFLGVNVKFASTPAVLIGADLTGADLRKANLSYADLRRVFFEDVKDPNEYLMLQGAYLEGATMPNGQKYEDWLEDIQGGEEDAENE
jgi:uncharacterized protein YjbI with pentapeptide repeats